MNQKTIKIAGWALGLSMAVAGIGAVVGDSYGAFQEKPIVAYADSPSTLTFTSACAGSGTANDGATWTVSSDASESNFDSTKGIKR